MKILPKIKYGKPLIKKSGAGTHGGSRKAQRKRLRKQVKLELKRDF